MKILSKPRNGTNLIEVNQYGFGYIPVPKVACTSFKFCIAKIIDFQVGEGSIHKELETTRIKSRDDFKDLFIFTFVRNPFERILSAFTNKIKPKRNIKANHLENGVHKALVVYYGDSFYGGMSFKQYVKNVYEIPDSHSDAHFKSQYSILHSTDGNPLYDFVGKLENLEADIEKLNKILKKPLQDIPVKNKTNGKKKHYSLYYDDEMVDLMTKRYSNDLNFFDYSYQNMNPDKFIDPFEDYYKT